MNHHFLSIVMPCYNCRATVEDAVRSIYSQGLGKDFELILVEDGSTDGTRDLITAFPSRYPNLKVVFHEENRGGGQARNTGIHQSSGNLLLCFDSDDLLPAGVLPVMMRFLDEKQADGVTFSYSYSFRNNPKKGRKMLLGNPGTPLRLENVFDGTLWPVGANFVCTRDAFEKSGGYPVEHNFDTQGFGIRFLSKGLKALPCPEAFFYQRQFGDQVSYFERAYVSGEFSVGFFLVYEELETLLSESAVTRLLGFPIFSQSDFSSNIGRELQNEYQRSPDAFFLKDPQTRSDGIFTYFDAVKAMRAGDFSRASAGFQESVAFGVHEEVAGFGLIRNLAASLRLGSRLKDLQGLMGRIGLKIHPKNQFRESLWDRITRKLKAWRT